MAEVTALWFRQPQPGAPVVVLLHGRHANERSMEGFLPVIPAHYGAVSVRGLVEVGPDAYAWFENRGIGRPLPESLRATIDQFRAWLDETVDIRHPVILLGWSGGTAFAGGLVLDDPRRYWAAALLYGTVPFAAGLDVAVDRLVGLSILHAQSDNDQVMPPDLMARTWDYLTNESGADLVTYKTHTGHQLSSDVAEFLPVWLRGLEERPRA